MTESATFPVEIKHPQIIAFAKAMDKVLAQNDYKGGWGDCPIEYLRHRLVEELGEYFHSLEALTTSYKIQQKELTDIANFAMMLWDRSY